jgi:hypothetical protein
VNGGKQHCSVEAQAAPLIAVSDAQRLSRSNERYNPGYGYGYGGYYGCGRKANSNNMRRDLIPGAPTKERAGDVS